MVDYSEIDSETECETVVCDIRHEIRKIVVERDSNVLVLTLELRRPLPDIRERARRRRGPTRRQRRRQTAC